MCLLFNKPKGQTMKDSEIELAWKRNSDGATLMHSYEKGGKTKWNIRKGIMTLEDMMASSKLWNNPDVELVGHLRWASPGTGKGPGLCHGFDFKNEKLNTGHRYLFHNGNFRFLNTTMMNSDTELCAQKVLSHCSNKEAEAILLNCAKKGFGKFIVFYYEGPVIIDNNSGIWEDGVYFSNLEHRKEPAKTYPWPQNGAHNPMIHRHQAMSNPYYEGNDYYRMLSEGSPD
jgi:hypothetical protein